MQNDVKLINLCYNLREKNHKSRIVRKHLRTINKRSTPSLSKDEVVVGAVLLSFWCYAGEPEFSSSHSFDLKGFFDW